MALHVNRAIKTGMRVCVFGASIALGGCAAQWSATGEDGVLFAEAAPLCRARAIASAKDQLPFPYDRDYGPAGFPPDSREDIVRRETARCLLDQGFTLERTFL